MLGVSGISGINGVDKIYKSFILVGSQNDRSDMFHKPTLHACVNQRVYNAWWDNLRLPYNCYHQHARVDPQLPLKGLTVFVEMVSDVVEWKSVRLRSERCSNSDLT